MSKTFEFDGQQFESTSNDPEALKDLEDHFAQMRAIQEERRAAVALAIPALERLCNDVLTQRSGQPYKVRNILWGLYNGKPCSIIEVLNLDWAIRKDLCQVLLAFGTEDSKVSFFYDAMKAAVTKAGQWKWFEEEHQNIAVLEEYVKAAKESERYELEQRNHS